MMIILIFIINSKPFKLLKLDLLLDKYLYIGDFVNEIDITIIQKLKF